MTLLKPRRGQAGWEGVEWSGIGKRGSARRLELHLATRSLISLPTPPPARADVESARETRGCSLPGWRVSLPSPNSVLVLVVFVDNPSSLAASTPPSLTMASKDTSSSCESESEVPPLQQESLPSVCPTAPAAHKGLTRARHSQPQTLLETVSQQKQQEQQGCGGGGGGAGGGGRGSPLIKTPSSAPLPSSSSSSSPTPPSPHTPDVASWLVIYLGLDAHDCADPALPFPSLHFSPSSPSLVALAGKPILQDSHSPSRSLSHSHVYVRISLLFSPNSASASICYCLFPLCALKKFRLGTRARGHPVSRPRNADCHFACSKFPGRLRLRTFYYKSRLELKRSARGRSVGGEV
ncbi:hypothetical protein E2C01_002547 [Portunus trituberculatus]|uniref:Uncharacterized protein n=1 Tax=Portunus trituberculatus TaxID=210409 RepID=A0A5B7CNJ2_PORTR|nr:hypothetical protein [Portunus trituberculatus]